MSNLKRTCLHELRNEIYKFMFLHIFTVVVCDKKADIITLKTISSFVLFSNTYEIKSRFCYSNISLVVAHLHGWFSIIQLMHQN